ncbi:MAG: hypothetical protein AAFR46_11865 [Pseudomonadota bacterium]
MTDPAPIPPQHAAPPVLLHRRETPRPSVTLAPEVGLALGRVHEACGPARRFFAALVAGRLSGPVLWILPAHERERLNPDGLRGWMDPARLVLVPCQRVPDIQWCMEEALRSGACPLVVAELPDPPALTPVRRLHLAAEAGSGAGGRSLGLLLTPGMGGAQGVESRWHLAPRPGWAMVDPAADPVAGAVADGMADGPIAHGMADGPTADGAVADRPPGSSGAAKGQARARPGRPRWELARLRARTAPEAGWIVEAGRNGLQPLGAAG